MIESLVIGTGPAGVAAARALVAAGRRVTIIDGGRMLEPAAEARRAAMAAAPPGDWSAARIADWQAPQHGAEPGQVRRFGSDFAMNSGAQSLDNPSDFALRSSHAAGGLSNLWGAAVLPFAPADMAGWPITAADLAPHYAVLADLLPIAGAAGNLDALFGGMGAPQHAGPGPTGQGAALLARAGARAESLGAAGLVIGAARTALAPGCRACGQCLHGCPWRLIWSAATALADLARMPGVSYRPGPPVVRLTEAADGVTLLLEGGESLVARRVYLAAGVLETARLYLGATGNSHALSLRDSHHGFLPMLHRWRRLTAPDVLPLTTLPQAFAELRDETVSPWLVHAQIYGWNDFFAADLIRNYGRRLPGSAPLWRALARRLMVAQIFLHSDHAHRARLTLTPAGRLRAEVEGPGTAGPILAAAAARYAAALAPLGLHALRFALRPGAPGSSFHAGASLPMARQPVRGQSDVLGRPQGFDRLHIVDASVLPAVPATTVTYPVMANAHRIASLGAGLPD